MVAVIDPRRIRLTPECAIECIDTAAVGTTNAIVGSYVINPYISTFENFQIESTANLDMVVAIDGASEAMKIRSNAVVPITADAPVAGDLWRHSKLTATHSAEVALRMTVGGGVNVYSRYNVTTRVPTIIDKIKLDIDMTSEEIEIAKKYDLYNKISMGVIPRYPSLIDKSEVVKHFERITEYANLLPAMAAPSTYNNAGYQIDVPQEYVYVLLGVEVDSTQFAAVFSNSFLRVDVDGIANYMSLDLSGMPVMTMVPCYLPFVSKMLVHVDTVAGSGGQTVAVNYIVGKRPATIIDHLKWGNEFPIRQAGDIIAVEDILKKFADGGNNIKEMIKAGLL